MSRYAPAQPTKYIAVTGGVCGSLDKGAIAASIGAVLKAAGYRVTAIKIDPYFNVDKSRINPLYHGEVFVLDDGSQVDLELGNFERAMDLALTGHNNLTSGKVWSYVIDKERRGDYLGKTVQMIPHVADEIIKWIMDAGALCTDGTGLPPHICLVELHGTVGDIELMLMLEALRILRFRLGRENVCLAHCSYVPLMSGVQKTKPTQHTVKVLSELGLNPDIVICRCSEPVNDQTRNKISQQCSIDASHILSVHTTPYMKYKIPVMLDESSLVTILTAILRLDRVNRDMAIRTNARRFGLSIAEWRDMAECKERLTDMVHIAVVIEGGEEQFNSSAKSIKTTYISVIKALDQAALWLRRQLQINWVNSADLEDEEGEGFQAAVEMLQNSDGIFLPGASTREVEGLIYAVSIAREHKKPLLCVGVAMQLAVVEFARNVLGLEGAVGADLTTTYAMATTTPVVVTKLRSGTQCLGARKVNLRSESVISKLYGGLSAVMERHRHSHEVAEDYIVRLEQNGMHFVGVDAETGSKSVFELIDHPFFVGTSFFPELKSRPGSPSPPFLGLLAASLGKTRLDAEAAAAMKRGAAARYRVSFGNASPRHSISGTLGGSRPSSRPSSRPTTPLGLELMANNGASSSVC